MDSMLQEIHQRKCMISGHNGASGIMRCTFKECKQPFRWLCVKCIKLHNDHVNYCLDIEEFANSLKVNNETYLFNERKQIKSKILEELANQKNLILSFFKRIEQKYLEIFEQLEQEENTTQALNSQIQTQNPLTLTEAEFDAFQIQQNEMETSLFSKKQKKVCSELMELNSKISNITLSLETLESLNQETIIEQLATNMNYSISTTGNLKNGIKFEQWKIINDKNETIGGGQYNSDGSKDGKWIDIEIVNSQNSLKYIRLIGEYKDGIRIGYTEINNQDGKTIGGGYYANGVKHGQWIDIELKDNLYCHYYYQNIGKYQDGKRIDQWEIQDPDGKIIKQMHYNQDGLIKQSK